MDQLVSKDKPWWRRRRLIYPIVMLLVLLLGCAGLRYHLHRRVEQSMARMRAAGYAGSIEELEARHAALPQSDATALYEQAFAAYVEDADLREVLPRLAYVDLPDLGDPWPPEMLAAAEQYLKDNAEALRLLHEAARAGPARFEVELRDPTTPGANPHWRDLRSAARLLATEAEVLAQRGDRRGALRAITAIAVMAQPMREEPVLIAALVSISLEAMAQEVTQRVLGHVRFDDAELAGLWQVLAQGMDAPQFAAALAGERVAGDYAIQTILASKGRAWDWGPPGGFIDLNRAALGEFYEVVIAETRLDQPGPLRIDAEKAIPRAALLARIMVPAAAAAQETVQGSRSQRGAVLCALSAQRYHLAHGRWPQRLEELVPEYLDAIPLDLMDGQPLRYLLTDDRGPIVYSVGRDRIDNGGVEHDAHGRPHRPGTDAVILVDPQAAAAKRRTADTIGEPVETLSENAAP